MCTAVSFRPKDHYFGRNLDLELSRESRSSLVTPRKLMSLISAVFRPSGSIMP